MGFLRFFAKRRFNWIDIVTVGLFSDAIRNENWWAAAVFLIAGAVVSAIAEQVTGEAK